MKTGYRLVHLRNGACSVRALAEDETFHPGIGPAAEAEALYVRQLRLPERVRECTGEFVIWDVGLGAAANALTTLRLIGVGLAANQSWRSRFSVSPSKLMLELQPPAVAQQSRSPKQIRLISFDHTSNAAAFALEHVAELGYLTGFEAALAELIRNHSVKFSAGSLQVEWTLESGDFPAFLSRSSRGDEAQEMKNEEGRMMKKLEPPDVGCYERNANLPAPHAILFDPHSPKKNPAMWTAPLFASLFRWLEPQRPCALATFTRSTMARVALLLGGFFVGVGRPSGLKEETTVAANRLDLLDEPLDRRWLERAKRSGSAEPLRGPDYRQEPLAPGTWEQLRQHPQFA